ncbi:MAG: hypothetical protein E7539_00560 [Ruminococcaceae bacterium]|nr:hypothetical protein [Oscillospiraceae bacterium]
MAERIYTIPVNEVFEEKDGCPICRLRDILEERSLEYVLGPAMMEDDVRSATNKTGFCKEHFFMMTERRSRLPLALILETHLDEVKKNIKNKSYRPDKKEIKSGNVEKKSCYVCDRIDWAKQRMYATIAKLYSEEMDFRELLRGQSEICFTHYRELHAFSAPLVSSRWRREFEKDVDALTLKSLETIRDDVHHFTKMFDYRNSGENADFKNSRDSIERAINYMTTRMPGGK